MDSADEQREQAIAKQTDAYQKAIDIEREHREKRLSELQYMLMEKSNAGDHELLVRIESIKEAGDKLASERDRAAEALRSANQKAIEQADDVRAKSADRLAEQLTEKIQSGDENLRLHIVGQARELDAARRETAIIHEASEKAIARADASTEKRFEAVNAFRQQLADQAGLFMPREVADTQIEELRKQIQDNTDRINTTQGAKQGSERLLAVGLAVATIVISIVVVLVNILISQM